MKRARGAILIGLLIVSVVGVCLWLVERSAKVPMVRGEPLDYWLTAGRNHQPTEFQAAVAEMDETCVPYLTTKLKWSPPTARIAINKITRSFFGRSLFSEEIQPDCREAAAMVLCKMGMRATNAIPALRQIVAMRGAYQKENYETAVQGAAIAALIQMKDQTLDSCVDKILEKQNTNWSAYAMATLYLHTNEAPVVPRLVNAFATTDDEEIQGRIAIPLRFIRSNPELSVPVLRKLLDHKTESVRFQATFGLFNFGAAAKPAWNDLTNHLTDSSESIRNATRITLKHIDPVEAKNIGIE